MQKALANEKGGLSREPPRRSCRPAKPGHALPGLAGLEIKEAPRQGRHHRRALSAGKPNAAGRFAARPPSASDGLHPRCLYVQFDVKKAGVLERALVAPVPVN